MLDGVEGDLAEGVTVAVVEADEGAGGDVAGLGAVADAAEFGVDHIGADPHAVAGGPERDRVAQAGAARRSVSRSSAVAAPSDCRMARQPRTWALVFSVSWAALRTRLMCFTVAPVTASTDAPNTEPTVKKAPSSDIVDAWDRLADRLGLTAVFAALAGWLPAISGYGWGLLALSAVCFCGWAWASIRATAAHREP